MPLGSKGLAAVAGTHQRGLLGVGGRGPSVQEGCKAQLTGQELGSSLWLRHLSRRAKGALPSRSMALGGGLGVCGWGARVVLPRPVLRERGRAF